MSHMRVIAACSSCTEFRRDHMVLWGGHGYYFALRPLPTPTEEEMAASGLASFAV